MLVLSYYYISVLKQKHEIEMRYIMKNYSKITPEGTKDFLFEECLSTRTVSHILGEVFSQRGFHEVLTPGVEFYDVFSNPAAQIPQENMFKLSDSKGRLMVVRPDSTLPIARMTATRLQNEVLPIRLYYNQRVYRNNRGLTGRSNEVMQTGIELLGISGKRADLEIITTAIEALTRCVPDFRIELGHAGFFKALLNKLPVSDNEREDIHSSRQRTILHLIVFLIPLSRLRLLQQSEDCQDFLVVRKFLTRHLSFVMIRTHFVHLSISRKSMIALQNLVLVKDL